MIYHAWHGHLNLALEKIAVSDSSFLSKYNIYSIHVHYIHDSIVLSVTMPKQISGAENSTGTNALKLEKCTISF